MQTLVISNVLLWLVLAGVAFALLGLARQIGVLHSRIAPAGALMIDKGIELHQPAPQITAVDIHQEPVPIGYKSSQAKLLFFMSPTCPICKSLIPAVKALGKSETQLDIIFVSDGEMADQHRLIGDFKLENETFIVSPEVGMTFQIGKLPYGVLIDQQGTLQAKGLVNSREHLDSLIEALHMGVGSLQEYLYEDATKTTIPSS